MLLSAIWYNGQGFFVEILTIGHACLDFIFSVESFPVEDSKTIASSRSFSGGGPTANAAALLGSWGLDAAWAGPIGKDESGDLVLEDFKRFGVDTALVRRYDGYPTPVSTIIAARDSGSRTIVNHRSAEDIYSLPQIDDEPACLLFDGHALNASLEALDRFPGVPSILDAGSMRDATWHLAEKVDYLVASAAFASSVLGTGISGREEAEKALEVLNRHNRRCTVITLGDKGGVWARGGERGQYAAYPVKAVDSTAAGDIFHGAFVYGLIQGWPLQGIVDFAAKTAGISVTRHGGREAFPSLEEVL